MSSAIGCPSSEMFSKTSTLVCQEPFFDFLPPGIFISSNNISPNCLGDPTLKTFLLRLKIFSSTILISLDKLLEISLSFIGLTITPVSSI